MPQKPVGENVRSATSQGDLRWVATVYDQHKSARFPRGRPWWGHLERPTNWAHDPGFVTELTPGSSDDPFGSTWHAPWYPDQVTTTTKRYFRVDHKTQSLTWLYATIITDDKAALQDYYEAAAQIAYTQGWKAPNFGEAVSFQIASILRKMPRSPKIAEAALAGDKYILGMTPEVNQVLADLLAGIRPETLLNESDRLSPAQVLAKPDDLEVRIQQAVAAALAAQQAAMDARPKKSHKKKPKAVTVASSSTALPDAA